MKHISLESADNAYDLALESMGTLNKFTASLMMKYGSHGATDITGFGILGHARNLVEAQKNDVDFKIHSLPVIADMGIINDNVMDFNLKGGTSAETSGGIMCMMPKEKVDDFMREHNEQQNCWIIGEVVQGSKKVHFEDPKIIDVDQLLFD